MDKQEFESRCGQLVNALQSILRHPVIARYSGVDKNVIKIDAGEVAYVINKGNEVIWSYNYRESPPKLFDKFLGVVEDEKE